MTQCIVFFKNFVSLGSELKTKNLAIMTNSTNLKRKEMLNQLVKINLVLLIILLLNGVSNSHQQTASQPTKEETIQALARLQSGHPLSSKIFNKNF